MHLERTPHCWPFPRGLSPGGGTRPRTATAARSPHPSPPCPAPRSPRLRPGAPGSAHWARSVFPEGPPWPRKPLTMAHACTFQVLFQAEEELSAGGLGRGFKVTGPHLAAPPGGTQGSPGAHGVDTGLPGESSGPGRARGFRQKSPPDRQLYSLRGPLRGPPLRKAEGNQRSCQLLEPSSSVHPCSHRGHRCITWSYVLIAAAQPGGFSVDNTAAPGKGPEEVQVHDTDYSVFALMLSGRRSGGQSVLTVSLLCRTWVIRTRVLEKFVHLVRAQGLSDNNVVFPDLAGPGLSGWGGSPDPA
ncbi:epididymal-specific lipocalin-12 isoform X1 [Neofelis nebulosa]|uniref:epididymal-specific lipocalin-12 isoform X1 n=1 Tax=Neofelis nebulosa TaxID=61452 RepID=UPI00272A3A3C|nr:epididymal-specific lipocalin-12 isoform X1 [Neofelis nebulosa]XP_058549448.1 epididymal-specific lipocalin-12 isoform X1 [Neofelis nebulosa]